MFDVNVNRIKNRGMFKNNELNSEIDKINSVSANAFFMAIVVDTNDVYKIGRVKIRVPSLHGSSPQQKYYLPDESLPWAKPATLNCAGNDLGQYMIPTKGTRVFITFEYNDFDKPIYFGGVPTKKGNLPKEYNDNANINGGISYLIDTDDRLTDLNYDSAQTVLFKSIKGSTIIIDDKDGKESIKIIDASGQQIILENESNEKLDRRGNNTDMNESCSISLITKGNINLTCNELNINAKKTNIKDYM